MPGISCWWINLLIELFPEKNIFERLRGSCIIFASYIRSAQHALHTTCLDLGLPCHLAARTLYEGPQFSTLAESNLYRSGWMIGMTNMPEAKLA